MSRQHAGSRLSQSRKAAALGFLFFAFIGGPALAANSLEPACDNATDTTLAALPDDLALHRDTAAFSAPQSDKAVSVPFAPRQADDIPFRPFDDTPAAFAESSVESVDDLVPVPNLQSEQAETSVLDASMSGASGDEWQRFKRQMFRKDI